MENQPTKDKTTVTTVGQQHQEEGKGKEGEKVTPLISGVVNAPVEIRETYRGTRLVGHSADEIIKMLNAKK